MQSLAKVGRVVLISLLVMAVAACAGQKKPARQLIGDIEVTVTAASAEAAKYVPEQLAEVQGKLGRLKASFDQQDYAAVVSAAPEVLAEAQALATAAAAKKDQVLKALEDSWTRLAAVVPEEVIAVQGRMDSLTKKSGKKLAAGFNPDAARASLGSVTALWSKAQAAFAAGNLDEAVRTAQEVKTQVEALAAVLKLDLAAPAATTG